MVFFFHFSFFILANAVDTPIDAIQTDDDVAYSLSSHDDNCGGLSSGHKDEFGYHPYNYDTAFFYINNTLNERIYVWGQSDECYQVSFLVTYMYIREGIEWCGWME